MSEISFNLRKKDAHLRKHRPIRLDTSKHYFFANSNMSNMRRNKQNIPEKGRSGKRECSPHGKKPYTAMDSVRSPTFETLWYERTMISER